MCAFGDVFVWAWAQWGRNSASSFWGGSMCPASTDVVLGHRCHLVPASHHSPSPNPSAPTVRAQLHKEARTQKTRCFDCLDLLLLKNRPQNENIQENSQSSHYRKPKYYRNAIQSFRQYQVAMILPSTYSACYTKLNIGLKHILSVWIKSLAMDNGLR